MEPSSTPAVTATHGATVVPRSAHSISRASISPAALKTLYRLKDAGYQAFVVGGGVRDLLLGIQPKDFDIATDAHPDDLRRVFRNCRLIGRRFRLAHVHWNGEIIEVATFRAAAAPAETDDEDPGEDLHADLRRSTAEIRVTDEAGRLLRDNIYGTLDDDVWRRDFTCNALYYNIADFSIWDYVGGVQDVQDRVLRLIGDPDQRYREDPVRLLRAVRFAGKLGFSIHHDTEAPMRELAPLLANVPPARLFDETLKLFLAGHAERTFALLEQHGLLEPLFPSLSAALAKDSTGRWRQFVNAGLTGGDKRVAEDRPVTPTFLFATLMYPAIEAMARRRHAGTDHSKSSWGQALGDACDEVMFAQIKRVAIPKRFTLPLRELLVMQPKFERRDGKRMLLLLNHPRFRAAYDLFVLRAEAGFADLELARFWTEVQTVPEEERLEMALALGTQAAGAASHPSAVSGEDGAVDGASGAHATEATDTDDDAGEGVGDSTSAPRKRRRRSGRRRPRGSGGAAPSDG